MEIFFEMLKYTIPALIVFATAYFLLQQQIDEQQKRLSGAMRQDSLKLTLTLRLQAYERLMLLCDRASIPNTLLRVRTPGMSIANLRGVLMIAITQEFDTTHRSSCMYPTRFGRYCGWPKTTPFHWSAKRPKGLIRTLEMMCI